MKNRDLLFLLLLIICSYSSRATTYYINTAIGNDANKGTDKKQAFKTIEPINILKLLPGDSVLFASGERFSGMLSVKNSSGTKQQLIVISSYSFKGNKAKPILDAGNDLNTILIENASNILVKGLEITGVVPYQSSNGFQKDAMRCGILVSITKNENFDNINLIDNKVHDVYYNPPGFIRSAAETKSANGTQNYGWGIRFINNTKSGQLLNVLVSKTEIYKVSHTGLKFTTTKEGIKNITVTNCKIYQTGGPGMQMSGVTNGHIHHNTIDHSGSTGDSRNWGRGSGLWTWSCSNILIEHNRFENANGPADSAGIHIDYNCNDVVVQYNFSANNAGGFCEILGNNYNCAYRYNISVNDGYRVKGVNGAFQEGKIFWLSGYQGNDKKSAGPFNSYFYNNTIYVSKDIVPKIAVASSAKGILVVNNIFYFEAASQMVAGDQKKQEVEVDITTNAIIENNIFLRPDNWPSELALKDATPVFGDAGFTKKGGLLITNYIPINKKLISNKGIAIKQIPNDTIGLKIGLKLEKDILGNLIIGQPDLGAIELK